MPLSLISEKIKYDLIREMGEMQSSRYVQNIYEKSYFYELVIKNCHDIICG